jgi:hypothetical protein
MNKVKDGKKIKYLIVVVGLVFNPAVKIYKSKMLG